MDDLKPSETLPTSKASSPTQLPARAEVERDRHRAWIGGRAVTIMRQFFDKAEVDALAKEIIADWMDVLEPLPQDAIEAGWIDYQRSGPRTAAGKLIKPCAGDLYSFALRSMFSVRSARQQQSRAEENRTSERAARERCSVEALDKILRANGFATIGETAKPMDSAPKRVHELKCRTGFYGLIRRGQKTFEVRLDDRGFAEGDCLFLREAAAPDGHYTGRSLTATVSYILRGFPGLETDYVVMSLTDVEERKEAKA